MIVDFINTHFSYLDECTYIPTSNFILIYETERCWKPEVVE